MRPRDAGLLTTLIGALALQVGLTQRLLNFLRPGIRTYLVIAGAALLVAGGLVLLNTRPGAQPNLEHDDSEHVHLSSRVGWLLLVPLLVAVIIAPGTLGSWAAAHTGGTSVVPRRDFDLGAFLRTQALVGGAPTMRLYDYYGAASDDKQRDALGQVDVRLVGFVTADPKHRLDRFVLNRFLVGCCVADATLLQVDVRGADSVPAKDSWVEATVRFLPRVSPPGSAYDRGASPVARLVSLTRIKQPSEPYEYVYR